MRNIAATRRRRRRSSTRPPACTKNLGVGRGVDFEGVFKVLRDRKFDGWAVLDLDPPRNGDGTGTIEDNLATNINYLRNILGVRLPAPAL